MKAILKKLALFILIFFTFSGCIYYKNLISTANGNFNETIDSLRTDNQYYYYTEAQVQKKRGNTVKAIACLKNAIKFDPDSTFLKTDLALLYLQQQDYQNALKLVKSILKKEQENIEALIIYGKIKHSLNDLNEAKKIYEEILAKDKKQESIYFLLGDLHLSQGNNIKALEIYRQLVKNFPLSYAGHYLLGKIFLQQKNTTEAENEFRETLRLEPSLIQPMFELIKIYKIKGSKEDIIKTYQEILYRDPDNIIALVEESVYFEKQKLTKKAENIFKELGQRSSSNPDVLQAIIELYIDKKEYNNALIVLEGMLKYFPKNSEIHYVAGVAYDEIKNQKMAAYHFKHVSPDTKFYENASIYLAFIYREQNKIKDSISLLNEIVGKNNKETNSNIFLYLGSFYEEKEEYKNAEQIFKKGLVSQPNNIDLLFRLGVLYDKWGKKEECFYQMNYIIKLDPKNADALNYLGYTYADSGKNLEEAEKLITEALKYKPDDAYITDSLGWVYYKKGNFQEAIKILEKAVSLAPDDPILLEHLGDAYLKINKKEKALELFKISLPKKKDKEKTALEKKMKELSGNGI